VPKPRNYWKHKQHVIDESKKYSSRTEFKKHSHSAYDSAIEMNLIDSMPWLDSSDKHPKGYWKDKENMMAEARKYKTNEEFKQGNLTAFLAAYRYGYIDEMDWLVKKKQHKKGWWTYEHIEQEALKYNTKTDFAKNSNTAYKAALKLGIIDDFFMDNYVEYD
jgi:hypothetical protein